MKKCTKCKIYKDLDQFGKDKGQKSGLKPRCKSCMKEDRELFYLKNLEYARQYARNWQANHKEARKIYLKKHKKQILKRQSEYDKKFYKQNINYKISKLLRNRVYFSVRGFHKSKSTLELLSCSIENLKNHLESQFKEGMTWDNYNKEGWHIDHIKPCACFDLSKPEEQAKCFHYSNLQPLWAEENLKKSAKYYGE